MPSATTARARFVLPLALWFEMGGTVVDGAGQRRESGAAAPPPGGALTASGLLEGLGAARGEPMGAEALSELLAAEPSCALADMVGGPQTWAATSAEGRLVLVSRADGLGFADGSVTSQLAWPATMEPRAVLRLSPQDAAALGSGEATVRSDGVAVTLPVEASADVPAGVGAVSPRFPEMRILFAWGERGAGPGVVSLEKSGGNDR
jgi:hypothetical protein